MGQNHGGGEFGHSHFEIFNFVVESNAEIITRHSALFIK